MIISSVNKYKFYGYRGFLQITIKVFNSTSLNLKIISFFFSPFPPVLISAQGLPGLAQAAHFTNTVAYL